MWSREEKKRLPAIQQEHMYVDVTGDRKARSADQISSASRLVFAITPILHYSTTPFEDSLSAVAFALCSRSASQARQRSTQRLRRRKDENETTLRWQIRKSKTYESLRSDC